MSPSGARSSWVLGIETSCDETAAAVVADGRIVRSNVVASQIELHAAFGGVFPELASRQHVRDIVPVVSAALREAGATWDQLAAIAVTRGPGLSGSLIVGVNAAKGIAIATGLPLVGVNHLEGHLYSNWLHVDGRLRTPAEGRPDPGDDPPFPHLALIVSGGHTELVHVEGHGEYACVGATLDDAAGEAFDKAARMLDLGYPGGPAIEAAARTGDASRFAFPVAVTRQPLDFSFSGLKTAVLRAVEEARDAEGSVVPVADIAAAFQEAALRALVGRVQRALERYPSLAVLVAGGVSANVSLRRRLKDALDVPVRFPPPSLCTDNAAMIAAAAFWRGDRAASGGFASRTGTLGLDVDAGLGLSSS